MTQDYAKEIAYALVCGPHCLYKCQCSSWPVMLRIAFVIDELPAVVGSGAHNFEKHVDSYCRLFGRGHFA